MRYRKKTNSFDSDGFGLSTPPFIQKQKIAKKGYVQYLCRTVARVALPCELNVLVDFSTTWYELAMYESSRVTFGSVKLSGIGRGTMGV